MTEGIVNMNRPQFDRGVLRLSFGSSLALIQLSKYENQAKTRRSKSVARSNHIVYIAITHMRNLEMLVVWGAGHNVQRVSRHGFEMYLAKYISKAEPTTKIKLPENASAPERYLKTRGIGAFEALQVLMGYQQHHMTRMAIYLPTELKPSTKVLKPKKLLEKMQPVNEDILFQS